MKHQLAEQGLPEERGWGGSGRGPGPRAAGALALPSDRRCSATRRDLCGTCTIDALCAWGQLNGSSVISLSRG